MRGAKPRPTSVRHLTGNPGKRAYPANEPDIPELEDPESVPPELDGDPVAADEWLRIVPILKRSRVLTSADRGAMLSCCQQWSRYLEANEEIQKRGMVIATPSGYLQPNPCIAISNKALGNLIKMWAEMGMTPSSRTRVSTVPEDTKADPFAEFDRAAGNDGASH